VKLRVKGKTGCQTHFVAILLFIVALCSKAQTAGQVDESFYPQFGGSFSAGSPFVDAVAIQSGGKILVGGNFTNVSSAYQNCIARLNTDGSLDSTFSSPISNEGLTTGDHLVSAIAVQPDGNIVVFGKFYFTDGSFHTVAWLTYGGGIDTNFDTTDIPDSQVSVVALQSDGKILLGGSFTRVSDYTETYVARFNTNGSLDTSFSASLSALPANQGGVNAIAVQPNGKILISGAFTNFNTTPLTGLARLNTNGTLDTTFNPAVTAYQDNPIPLISVQSDGKILISGLLANVNGQNLNGIARLGTNGALDTTFLPDKVQGGTPSIAAISIQASGEILVGGWFTNIEGQSALEGQICTNLARLGSNGTPEAPGTFEGPPFAGDFGNQVYALANQENGDILAGGQFSIIAGNSHAGIARLTNAVPQNTLTNTSSLIKWSQGGSAPELIGTTFEVFDATNQGWTLLGNGGLTNGAWQLAGLNLPPSGIMRAQGQAMGGIYGSSSGQVEQLQAFGGANLGPTIVTLPATGITTTTAVLNGSINSLDADALVFFSWWTNAAAPLSSSAVPSSVDDSVAVPIAVQVSNLKPGTTYVFQTLWKTNANAVLGNTLTFTTISTNAGLANLTVTGAAFSPAFNPTNSYYAASVAYGLSNVRVTATAADTNASIYLLHIGALNSGIPSAPIPVSVGANAITISVTAQDESTESVFTIDLTRLMLPPAPVISGSIVNQAGQFSLTFLGSTNASYTVYGTTNMTLSGSNWTLLGQASVLSSNLFQFTDPQASNILNRFYQVRSP